MPNSNTQVRDKESPEPSEKDHKAWFRGFHEMVDLLLPPACRLCDEPTDSQCDFCDECWHGLTLSEKKMANACRRCGRPGAIFSAHKNADIELPPFQPSSSAIADANTAADFAERGAACGLCKKEKFTFGSTIARWTYEGRVCDAIIAAKYAGNAALGNALGRCLGQRVVNSLCADPPDVVTIVPSHFGRQLTRGGRNGNLAIAQAVNRCLRAAGAKSTLRQVLRTTRRIKKQAWLTDKEREKNVAGAFAVKKSYAWRRTPGPTNPHILLVDDVVTTGATAKEAARVLLETGARSVTLAVVARAVWSS